MFLAYSSRIEKPFVIKWLDIFHVVSLFMHKKNRKKETTHTNCIPVRINNHVVEESYLCACVYIFLSLLKFTNLKQIQCNQCIYIWLSIYLKCHLSGNFYFNFLHSCSRIKRTKTKLFSWKCFIFDSCSYFFSIRVKFKSTAVVSFTKSNTYDIHLFTKTNATN